MDMQGMEGGSSSADVDQLSAERFVIRAIAFATGHANPFTTTVYSGYSDGWPQLVHRYIGEIDLSRRKLGAVFERAEARAGELASAIAALPPSSLTAHAASRCRSFLWVELYRLALLAERYPDIRDGLDATVMGDVDHLAECLGFVLEQPEGEVADILSELAKREWPTDSEAWEYAIPPSSVLTWIRKARESGIGAG